MEEKIPIKLSKDDFREIMTAMMESKNDIYAEPNKKEKEKPKAPPKKTATKTNKEKMVYTSMFEKHLKEKKINFINLGASETGLTLGQTDFTVKIGKKNKRITPFETNSEITDSQKSLINEFLEECLPTALQKEIIEKKLCFKTEMYDYMVTVTAKKGGIEGL